MDAKDRSRRQGYVGNRCERCPKLGRQTEVRLFDALRTFDSYGYVLCLTCSYAASQAMPEKAETKTADAVPFDPDMRRYRDLFDRCRTENDIRANLAAMPLDVHLKNDKTSVIEALAEMRIRELEICSR